MKQKEDEGNCWDACGACGGRRDDHIPGIGNTFFAPTCPEFRPTDEQGEWRWMGGCHVWNHSWNNIAALAVLIAGIISAGETWPGTKGKAKMELRIVTSSSFVRDVSMNWRIFRHSPIHSVR